MVDKPCQADKESKSKLPHKRDENVVKRGICVQCACKEVMCMQSKVRLTAFLGFGFFINLS